MILNASDRFDDDPLISRPIASNILLALYETAERIVADAAAVVVPTQLLISGADWVVHHQPQHQFYERLGSHIKERHVLPGFYHDTLGEKERAQAVDKVQRFILDRFAEPHRLPSLLDADRHGFTRREADQLATPLSVLTPRGIYWAATRLALKIGGWISDGIKLGHQTGFDSGSTLDYVYRNQPRGKTRLGKLIDTAYLESIGWRGIRQRKVHIEELIGIAMERLRDDGQPVHIMDIAAGHGRYILEAIAKGAVKTDSILLRDYSELNIEQGRALIEEKGIADLAKFVKATPSIRTALPR